MRHQIVSLAVIAAAAACSSDNTTNGTTSPSGETVLQSVTPTGGATSVDPGTPVTVRFSGPMADGMQQYVDLHQGGIAGIGFSAVVVVIAALNLVLDFDFIEEGVARGAPKHMEWYAAFGLLVTLVWLYLELLRLIANTRR